MQFITALLALAATVAATNSVKFVNQDSTTRTIYFTGNPGQPEIPELTVPGSGLATQVFPDSYIGNFYSVNEGSPNTPGMLGEVAFGGFAGATFFDVSAIVNPGDTEGVKTIHPANSATPISGCPKMPCANQYNAPDDVATLSTTDTELICTIGKESNKRRRGVVARARDFVTS